MLVIIKYPSGISYTVTHTQGINDCSHNTPLDLANPLVDAVIAFLPTFIKVVSSLSNTNKSHNLLVLEINVMLITPATSAFTYKSHHIRISYKLFTEARGKLFRVHCFSYRKTNVLFIKSTRLFNVRQERILTCDQLKEHHLFFLLLFHS